MGPRPATVPAPCDSSGAEEVQPGPGPRRVAQRLALLVDAHLQGEPERGRAPERARRLRSTPGAPAAHRHARRRGAAQRRGSPALPACVPPPHRRARSAVHAPAPLAVARAGWRYSSPACPGHAPVSRPGQRPRWRHAIPIGPPAAHPLLPGGHRLRPAGPSRWRYSSGLSGTGVEAGAASEVAACVGCHPRASTAVRLVRRWAAVAPGMPIFVASGVTGRPRRRLVRRWAAAVAGMLVFVASGVTGRPRLLAGGDQTVRRGCSHRRGAGHPRSRIRSRLIGIPVTRCARPSRQPKQIVAVLQTDVRDRSPALALGGGKGGLHLCRRGQTQIAAVQHGPHPPMTPAQPHGLDTPLRGGIGEAQLPHRVVEQAREPAPQRQVAAVDLVEMVQDVHFEDALVGREALGLVDELLITEHAEGPSAGRDRHTVNITLVVR